MQEQGNQRLYARFERWFEAVEWLLAAGFAWLGWSYAPLVGADREMRLYLVAGLFAVTAVVYYRILPTSSDGPIRYQAQDKVLLTSITLFALITAGLYALGLHQDGLVFLYLLPMLSSTMLFDEKVILAVSALALLSTTFLHAATRLAEPIFQTEFNVRLAVFFGISLLLVYLTGELRKREERARSLVDELSARLDQIQVISILVRQIDVVSDLPTLLRRLTEIIASAFGVPRCGIYLVDERTRELRLQAECCGLSADEQARLDADAGIVRKAYEEGRSLSGAGAFPAIAAAPLRMRSDRFGAVFIADVRARAFAKGDLEFLEMLGGYVATLVDSARTFKSMLSEHEAAARMTKLLVGRELRMKELKRRLEGNGSV